MRNYIIIFFCLLVFTSCYEKIEKKETIREYLSKNFQINQWDYSSFVIDKERSYINDTIGSTIKSMVITKPNFNIIGTYNLKRFGYREIQEYIDTLDNIVTDNTIILKMYLPENNTNSKISTATYFKIPIEFKRRKNLLMKPIILHKRPITIVFYDTLENEFYHYKSAYFKRGIF